MSIIGRKVSMFRCVVDPHIPPKSRQAFSIGTGSGQTPGEAEVVEHGVILRTPIKDQNNNMVIREYVIPIGNIQVYELAPEEVVITRRSKEARAEANHI